MKLALDHHYSTLIADQLRALGFDAVAAAERGWDTHDDHALLEVCCDEWRALLTNNVGDFAVIARQWAIEQRAHAGLIFTSDSQRPRTRRATGRFVADLADLMSAHDSFANRVWWL